MPINFVFMFLMYTEMATITLLLLLYYRVVCRGPEEPKRSNVVNFLIGLAAFLVRQISIVWVNYIVLIQIIQSERQIKSMPKLIKHCFNNLGRIVSQYKWLVLSDFLFVGYIILNGGSVVLGDKNGHKAVLHLTQILYLLLALVICPWGPTLRDHLQALKDVAGKLRSPMYILAFVILFSANLFIVFKFSYTHIYAEFGYQHYVHTFHEKVIKTSWRFALVPVYTYLMFHVYHLLKRKSTFADFGQHQVFIFAIYICSAATLIPAGLVEPRYFIISWVMLSLEWQLHNTDVDVSYKKREDDTPSSATGG